jgi:hypothetical protein
LKGAPIDPPDNNSIGRIYFFFSPHQSIPYSAFFLPENLSAGLANQDSVVTIERPV